MLLTTVSITPLEFTPKLISQLPTLSNTYYSLLDVSLPLVI